jgi:hypothetical protein
MTVEQTARDFIARMDDEGRTRSLLTPDAMVSGGVLPKPAPALEALNIMGALKTAIPDLKFDIQKVTVNGNEAMVTARWGGTHTGPLNLPVPGMSSIPPTGKKVSVMDAYKVTVQGDKVSRLEVDSPSGGGIPGALAQLGIKTPGM